MFRRVGVAALALALASALSLVSPHAQQPGGGNGRFISGEILVEFGPGVSQSQRNNIVASRGARVLRRFQSVGVDRLRIPPGQAVAAAVSAFRSIPGVVRAQPNYIRRPAAPTPPDDPYWSFGLLWGLERIQVHPVWTAFTTGSPDVVIADLDTGVDYTHPDLAANMWRNPGEVPGNGVDDDANGYVDDVFGIDAINGDSDPMDDQGHGTHTAGTIAAIGDNGVGVVGIAYGSKILTCKFIDSSGTGTDAGAIECFDYIVAMKARGVNIRISNNSWGGLREGEPATVLQGAIDAAGAAGILNVFAAGNEGTKNDVAPYDPASFQSPSIIAVAASNQADGRPTFSNYGGSSVDLAAPGDFILSTTLGTYTFSSGTSMAAPHVAGAAALLISKNPALSVDDVKAVLIQTVDVVPAWSGLVASGGRLNVLGAANAAGGNVPPTVTLTAPAPGASFLKGTPVTLEATSSDTDGTVSRVDFYANGVLAGTDFSGSSGVFTIVWAASVAGTYTLTAVATDDGGATRTSDPVSVTLTPPPGRMNVALGANGGVASASSSFGTAYPASSVNNGDRRGLGWGNGGGWADGTPNVWPDWMEVQFNGPQSIEEIDVFMVQDSYATPVEPTPDMTFTKYGVRDFVLEYWTGTAWQAIPGGTVIDNANVWRQFHFAPVTTSRIRATMSEGLASHSRLTEIEAYAVLGSENRSPSVTMTSPPSGTAVGVAASVPLEAAATDSDGTVVQVAFYANGSLVGTDTSGNAGSYGLTWSPVVAGSYSVTAVATDDRGGSATSTAVSVSVAPPPGRVNVALAANGGRTVASSSLDSNYPATSVINGDRKGLGWGSGGGWADGTANAWPDWMEVQFNGLQLVEEIDVFTIQDNFSTPGEPSLDMSFTQYGIRDFVVEYWTGSAWQPVSGGSVDDNNRVWRQFHFSPVTTSRIRVLLTDGLASRSRLVEIEAYATLGSENQPPSVALTAPASGAQFQVGVPVTLEATAGDSDGSVSRVDFYANGVFVGASITGSAGVYTSTWSATLAGSYTLTAVAADDRGATRSSDPVSVTMTPPSGRLNVALATNGAVAMPSSTLGSAYPAGSVINGDRKGTGWGSGGGWADGTPNAWPDWLEVQFNGTQTIEEIDLFTVQDEFATPAEPTLIMTFTKYGVRDFVVQYWTGTGWQAIEGGTVSGNSNIWRQFYFAPVTTSRIRVSITAGLGSHSRLTEVEAYAVLGTENDPPAVVVTSPASGIETPVDTPIVLEAAATDEDGTVARVEFYANGTLVGTDASASGDTFGVAWTPALAGAYSVTAVAVDDRSARRTSGPVTVTVVPPTGRTNVALAVNGGVASASSTLSTAYPVSSVIDADRKGIGWGSGGGWSDATVNFWPDWVEIRFPVAKTIEEVDVFTVQDDPAAPVEPSLSTTFTKYGVTEFRVEYWNGSRWVAIPGAAVSGNTRVWRQFNFAPITTSRVRVVVTNGLASRSRLVEVEVYEVK